MKREHLVIVDFNGKVVEGTCKPAVDTKTHLVLYQSFTNIGGITHTHSQWATIWAQACRPIPCFGTTHADNFYGEIHCTEKLTRKQIESDYEQETGNAIVKRFKMLNPDFIPGVLVASHGSFTWGKDSFEAVHNSVVLEEIAKMAWGTLSLSPEASPISSYLLDKHFFRKHGPNAYFGQ
jgi:L-ribulose-5-phosphate 4-epimerase